MTYPSGATVVRQRAVEKRDPYSEENTFLDWATPIEATFEGCAVWQESAEEPAPQGTELRSQTIVVTKVTVPFDADIKPKDRLVIFGEKYEVRGPIDRVEHPMTGWRPGAVATGVWISG